MGQVTVTIDNREYAVICEDGQESHIIKLSKILDERAKQITASVRGVNANMVLALVGLTLADELQDIKDGLFCIRPEDVRQKDAELSQAIDKQTAKISDIISHIKSL